MDQAVLDSLVTGYELHMPSVSLPDPNDVHIVSAAIRSGAQIIVTFNLKDFPKDVLSSYGLEPFILAIPWSISTSLTPLCL